MHTTSANNYFRQLARIAAGTLIIAGPCAAENREQVLTTARGLRPLGVGLFRAGVWKPRTRPGAFEGAGQEALPWLQQARQETGLPVAIEVAQGKHVDAALTAGIDVLWIGARTTVNPFAVQDIADALRGTDIPVMVKNPVNPELLLWVGALERLQAAGCSQLAAVFRGFSCLSSGRWRNEPLWQIAIDLRQRFPQLPLFCDPSHIVGQREGIAEIAQLALNLDFDGLMLEAHCCPEKAASDAEQQLTPENLATVLRGLIVRQRTGTPGSEAQKSLRELRLEIDSLDEAIIATMARRMQVSRKMGLLKQKHNLTVLQSTRWEQVLKQAKSTADKLGLNSKLVEQVFKLLHQESIDVQQKILQSSVGQPPSQQS